MGKGCKRNRIVTLTSAGCSNKSNSRHVSVRAGRGWQNIPFATSFKRFKSAAETPSGKTSNNSDDENLIGLPVINCLNYKKVYLEVIGTCSAFYLIGILFGAYLKCQYMFLITIVI